MEQGLRNGAANDLGQPPRTKVHPDKKNGETDQSRSVQTVEAIAAPQADILLELPWDVSGAALTEQAR
jgi:hypothetical protein